MLARSVSPTITKTQNKMCQSKLQVCLQAQTSSKKRLPRNKHLFQSLRIDVSKAVKVPVPPDQDMSPKRPILNSIDQNIVDLAAQISKEEAEHETGMKAQVGDAVGKWCGGLHFAHQQRIAHVALKFLRHISPTISLIASTFRLLARAPWISNMIAIDIKQAALYAVSKDWHLRTSHFREFPFSKAEFAVAAATYLERVPHRVPDDPLPTITAIIDFLPLICGNLFSQATLFCPCCKATCTTPAPCFISKITWTMEEWNDFATAISKSHPCPWIQRHGWHNEGCDLTGCEVSVDQLGPWVYLQLQAENDDDLPMICQSMQITKDSSLHLLEATVTSFLGTNPKSSKDSDRHYWVAEVENSSITAVYDSVNGKQKLTQALAKNLRVCGVLLCVGPLRLPTLRSKELDRAAGIISRVQRREVPIKVAGRHRLQKTRNAICKRLCIESTSGKRVKKHTLKSRPVKTNRQQTSSSARNSINKDAGLAARQHKKRKSLNTLPQFFCQAPAPLFCLWNKPLEEQCISHDLLEISDASPQHKRAVQEIQKILKLRVKGR